MGKQGKTLTIFLVVISILLLCLTGISLFFYQNESKLRKDAETSLSEAKASEAKVRGELAEAKKNLDLSEKKLTEKDDQIESLTSDVELEKGINEQIKQENVSLREAVGIESKEKENLQKEILTAQEKVAALEQKLAAESKAREEAQQKTEALQKQQEQAAKEEVNLEPIVITPGQISPGIVLSTNQENNFLVFNLGEKDGIKPDMIMSVYRKNAYLGDIKVTRVQPGMSAADMVLPLTIKKVRKDDKVLVKDDKTVVK